MSFKKVMAFHGALSRQQCRSNSMFEAAVLGASKSLGRKPKGIKPYLEMELPCTREQWDYIRPALQESLGETFSQEYVIDMALVVMLLILRFGKDYLGVGVRHYSEWFFWGQNLQKAEYSRYMTVDMAKLYPGAVREEESIQRERLIYRQMTWLATIFVLGIVTLLAVRF